MKEFSQEIIEIDGVEYTLFLNRAGILAWEQYSQKENEEVFKLKNLVDEISNGKDIEITDDTDPLKDAEKLLTSDDVAMNSYKKLFWVLLRVNHKTPYSEALKLFDKACEEYGREQVIALEDQMVSDANINRVTKEDNLKKLPALRPTK
jgi:hypothetical protein